MTGSDVSLLGHLHYLFTYRSMYLFYIFDGLLGFFSLVAGYLSISFPCKEFEEGMPSTHSYQIELQSHEKGACVHQRPARAGFVNDGEGLKCDRFN